MNVKNISLFTLSNRSSFSLAGNLIFLVFGLLLLIAGCSQHSSQQTGAPKLAVFDCGRLDYQSIQSFGLSDSDTPVREMFVPCYLIEHQGKRLIWDAGLPLLAVGKGEIEAAPELGITMQYQRSLLDQLSGLGLQPDDVDYLAMSHVHFDHAGAANAFKNSIWIMQRPEYQLAKNNPAKIPGADPRLFSEIANVDVLLLEGDYDLFGDGKVKIISTPGHTVGHQVLFIELKQLGPILLSGDLFHFRATRRLSSVPVFNYNHDQTLDSMRRIEKLIKETGAALWIEHDMELAKTLRKSPYFYR